MSQKKVSEEDLALWIEQVHNSSCCSDVAITTDDAEVKCSLNTDATAKAND